MILDTLVESGAQPLPDLFTKSGMDFADFMDAFKTMRDAGLITISPELGHDKVVLTPTGEQMAQLTR